MYIPLNTKSKSLAGLTDLTVMAPIRPGLVPSLDSITYKSRLRRLMEVLQALRQASHEYVPFRPISDSAERVSRIHSFRVAIVEPDKLLLAVTFDGARESYIRVLWQKIGTLLDLLFCNTVGHVPAYGRSMAEWDAWIDGIQVKTDFFYARPGLTNDDVQFLRDEDEVWRSSADATQNDLASVRRTEPTAEMRAFTLANIRTDPGAIAETARQGIQTVALLHSLTPWFIPHTPDGDFLHRAARDLVAEFTELVDYTTLMEAPLAVASSRFAEAITWFKRPEADRVVPAPPTHAPDLPLKRAIQSGILEPYAQNTHGALLMLAFKPGAPARAFWSLMRQKCVSAQDQPSDRQRTVWNVALTYDGLRAAGLMESELAAFPAEFREGMERRNGVLGDVWINHPDRWRRPLRRGSAEPIELSAVHVVVQLRCGQAPGMRDDERNYDLDSATHPLHHDIRQLESALAACIEVVAWQPMVRHLLRPGPDAPAVEHFGFVDGSAQPELDPKQRTGTYPYNVVHPGEFVVGLANAGDPAAGEGAPSVSDWLRHSSFLVLRKLSQDVAKFRDLLEDAASKTGLASEVVAGKLVGRMRGGDPLAAPGSGNDFNYDSDPEGRLCPIHAHIRRANPRTPPGGLAPRVPPGERQPRIMRRSMSFGAPLPDGSNDAPAEAPAARGVCFMAYNARIAEQFEVVQRWLAGGNSTGGYSGRSDPLIGIAPAGEKRTHVFEEEVDGQPKIHRVSLDGNGEPTVLPDPLVRLEWGMYLFTPSLATLEAFEKRAEELGAKRATVEWPWSADRGRAAIDRLQALAGETEDRVAAWKAALEDPEALKNFSAASIWAAVRRDFGGVLRTPYGVLAASHEYAQAVLSNASRRYTVEGYRERAEPTLGDMYLGLDDLGSGCPYRASAAIPNQIISSITQQQACDAARQLTDEALRRLVDLEQDNARDATQTTWQLQFGAEEVWDEVLEGLCQQWFGLADHDKYMSAGSFRWAWQPSEPVPYPGHFLSPSRYIFQPRPGSEVQRFGTLHGTAVNSAFRAWVTELRDNGQWPLAPDRKPAELARAFFEAFPRTGSDRSAWDIQDEQVAVTIVGALIGFLPTVAGNLRQSLNEWLLDGTFWSLRAALSTLPPDEAADAIDRALKRSMMLRPAPEVVWRRATGDHMLGNVAVATGDTVVVAIVSATHELLEMGKIDEGMVFGGWPAPGTSGISLPTHACPGRAAAVGTLRGILTGLLECKQALRPTAFPLSFRMEGEIAPPKAPPTPTLSRSLHLDAISTGAEASAVGSLPLLAGGDSWYAFRLLGGGRSDLAKALTDRSDVRITLDAKCAVVATKLAAFAGEAETPGLRDSSGSGDLCRRYKELVQSNQAPVAILLSLGGNDLVSSVLKSYVLDISQSGKTPDQITDMVSHDTEFIAGALERLMDGQNGVMRRQVRTILDKLGRHCVDAGGRKVPVIWQGYDHPLPDGRGVFNITPHRPTSSIWQPLKDLGYTVLANTTVIMKTVVDRYNELLKELSADSQYAGQLVHADLRGTLVSAIENDAYMTDWQSELHATPAGFAKLANRLFSEHLNGLVVPP